MAKLSDVVGKCCVLVVKDFVRFLPQVIYIYISIYTSVCIYTMVKAVLLPFEGICQRGCLCV